MAQQQHNADIPKMLYHYTNKEGMQGILRTNQIYPSMDTVRDAMIGQGTYLTSVPPDSPRIKILCNNYGTHKGYAGKADHCIPIPTKDLNPSKLARADLPDRDVWVYRGTLKLPKN